MIDARATRPGDVLTAANGMTVEVNNTDAEGRLTLADGLWFAQEHAKVEAVVDIATLTGAMMIALGQGIAGAFTPSDALADKLKTASSHVGEKVWRMPVEDSYWDIMKSPIADMKNAGNKYAGSITAALFLQQYVDTEKVQWAHIDIAGTAWDDKLGGATGYGAALLAQWAILEGQ
jgi:leucyl aminopeptidase